jgi:hypothetical protein
VSDRIRWYNRLAAWLWHPVGDRWLNLCAPVWGAEAESEDEPDEPDWIDDALWHARAEGYNEGLADAGPDRPPF